MLLVYLASLIMILLYSLVVWLGLTKILKKSLFYSPIIFILFLGVLSFVLTLFNSQNLILYLVPSLLLLKPSYKKIKELNSGERNLLILFVLMFLFYSLIQSTISYYPLGKDWYKHYISSLELSNNNFQLAHGRNPLFNLIEAAFLSMFGKEFYIAQIVSVLVGSFIIFPFYLLSKKLLKRKNVSLSLLFLIFNPFIIQNSLYNWPKMLVTVFVLYFIYFVLERKYFATYVTASLGFFSHSLSLFFVIPAYIIKILQDKKFANMFVLLIVTIFIASVIKNIVGISDPFVYYPIAVNGYEQLAGKTTNEIIQDFLSKPIYYHFFVRGVNLANTVFPTILILKTVNLFVGLPDIIIHKTVDIGNLPLIYHYFHSLPGALTFGVYVFALVSLYRNRKDAFVNFIIAPIIFSVLVFGWIMPGLVQPALTPIVPLMLIYSIKELQNFDKKMMYFILAIMVFELLVFSYLYFNFIDYFIETCKDEICSDIFKLNTAKRLAFG